ncbi:hypothetical protein L7F22_026008, partial [Adiantum nelumboides]|nr:hypothetical protein [Adiantum nelumboides]
MGLRSQLFCCLLLLAATVLYPTPQVLGVDNLANGATLKRSSKSPILSLFNLKGRSKFWNEKVMHAEFEDLERPDVGSSKAALTNYTMA